jgi:hypothetical protein
MGLLQGADISEPFGDRLISTSIHSDIESIHSLEHEPNPSPPIDIKEPIDFVFDFPQSFVNEEFDLNFPIESEIEPLNISITFDNDDYPPVIQMQDVYSELALFRPHSLSTIPSSRASQYASSVESDDDFERGCQINKDNHISDDDHGVIGSEFSSPQSGPLSSINSRPLSPELNQVSFIICFGRNRILYYFSN